MKAGDKVIAIYAGKDGEWETELYKEYTIDYIDDGLLTLQELPSHKLFRAGRFALSRLDIFENLGD